MIRIGRPLNWLLLATALNAQVAVAGERPEVLLYLANETAPLPAAKENLDRVVGWLRSSDEPSDRELAGYLVEDVSIFQESVDTEMAALKRRLTGDRAAILVTNRLLHEGVVLVQRPNSGAGLERVPMKLPVSNDVLVESSPLIDETNLDAMLTFAAAQFDPKQYDFVVVIHSHGDEAYAITPRVALDSSKFTRESMLARLHDAAKTTQFFERAGVTTQSLLDHLAAQHAKNAFTVPLLVMHSCHGNLEKLPESVRVALVAAGDGEIPHEAVNYDQVLAPPFTSFSEALATRLTPAPFDRLDPETIPRRAWLARLRSVSPFIPLLAWTVVAVIWWRRRKPTEAVSVL